MDEVRSGGVFPPRCPLRPGPVLGGIVFEERGNDAMKTQGWSWLVVSVSLWTAAAAGAQHSSASATDSTRTNDPLGARWINAADVPVGLCRPATR